MSISNIIFDYFRLQVFPRWMDLAAAPYYHPELLWITIPLILVTLFMEFYFGRYNKEELGWNTAVGNSLVLMFVALDLFRYVYNNSAFRDFFNFVFVNAKGILIASIIAAEGFILFFGNFFHLIPKRFAFFASGALQINMTAYIAIVLVYSNIEFDWATLTAGVIFYFMLLAFFSIIHLIEPKAREAMGLETEKKNE